MAFKEWPSVDPEEKQPESQAEIDRKTLAALRGENRHGTTGPQCPDQPDVIKPFKHRIGTGGESYPYKKPSSR